MERLTLVCPGAWCALRPMPLSLDRWAAAREEVLRSIEGFVPIPAEHALIGLIDRRAHAAPGAPGGPAAAAGPGASYLVALDRRRIEPWLAALASALGRPVDVLLSSHGAALGVGAGAHDRALVLDGAPGAAIVAHRFEHGEVIALAEPLADADADGDPAPFRIEPTPAELALGAALLPRVAPGRCAPLMGRPTPAPRRWLAPASLAAAAALVMLSVPQIDAARSSAATERLLAQIDATRDGAQAARRERDEAMALIERLRAAQAIFASTPPSVLPALAAAQGVVPDDGFLYRVELDATSATLRGEAPRASDVLRALEATPQFQSARQTESVIPVEERSAEQFTLRADREASLPAGPLAPTRAPAQPAASPVSTAPNERAGS